MTEKDPFILDRATGRRLRARDALICVGVAVLLLLLFEGGSIRNQGEEMAPGIERSVVLAVGKPAGWLADRLPLDDGLHEVTAFLSPDDEISGPGGFEQSADTTAPATGTAGGPGTITPDYFDAKALGDKPARLPALHKLLVTGDSMAQPLDVQLARRLSESGVGVVRDAHLGTAISSTAIVDWGQLATSQVRKQRPEAVVMFIGANDAFPMTGPGGREIACCGSQWAAIYATRARRLMDIFRRGGAARVYWMLLPLPRDPKRIRIARNVNAAIAVAAQPYRADVRLFDLAAVFTPGGSFRSSMLVNGRNTIVRRPDGIHLNDAGAELAAGLVEARIRADFSSIGG